MGFEFEVIMWVVWSALVVITAAMFIYRISLTRDEDDQIYLDDAFQGERDAQALIVARVSHLEPYLKTGYWLVAAGSAFIVVYYVIDFINKLK